MKINKTLMSAIKDLKYLLFLYTIKYCRLLCCFFLITNHFIVCILITYIKPDLLSTNIFISFDVYCGFHFN